MNYQDKVQEAIKLAGGLAPLARELGTTRSAIQNRLDNPSAVRREHELAISALLKNLKQRQRK